MKIVVGNSATQIAAADTQRTVLRLKNTSPATTVYVGEGSGVTVGTGAPLGHGGSIVVEGKAATAAYYGIVHAGFASVDAHDR